MQTRIVENGKRRSLRRLGIHHKHGPPTVLIKLSRLSQEASGQSNPFNDPLTAPTPSDDADSTTPTRGNDDTDNPAPDSYESFTEVSVKQNASREKVLPSSVAPTSRLHPVFGGASGASGSRRQSNASSSKVDHDLTTLKGSKLERDLSDVEVVVCDPQRIEKENYILYLVKTKVRCGGVVISREHRVHAFFFLRQLVVKLSTLPNTPFIDAIRTSRGFAVDLSTLFRLTCFQYVLISPLVHSKSLRF